MRIDPHRSFYAPAARALERLGTLFSRSGFGSAVSLFARLLRLFAESVRRGHQATNQLLVSQIYFTSVEAVPLIALVAALLGTVVVMQALTVMPKVGFGGFFGNIMVIVIIRELGPLFTAFLVTGRSGAALATLIGNMKVDSEVDALESLGIDSVRYLAMPAVIGMMVGMFCLNTVFWSVAVFAGFLFAKASIVLLQIQVNMDLRVFMGEIVGAMGLPDIVMSVVKPVVFGAIISTLACWNGLRIPRDARKVPVATGRTVVVSYVMVILADLLLGAFYLGQYYRQLKGVI
ncbi:MAG: ABC transporter permease [Fibrobacterales bacterium]|nr:ABC transporter permease [Fibrobacterales bacterium]